MIVDGKLAAALLNTTRTLVDTGVLLSAIQAVAELSQCTQLIATASDVSINVDVPANLVSGFSIGKISAEGL